MECLLFTVCVMSGALSVSKQGMGKTEGAPSNVLCLFGQGQKLAFGARILTKQFHLSKIRLQAANTSGFVTVKYIFCGGLCLK